MPYETNTTRLHSRFQEKPDLFSNREFIFSPRNIQAFPPLFEKYLDCELLKERIGVEFSKRCGTIVFPFSLGFFWGRHNRLLKIDEAFQNLLGSNRTYLLLSFDDRRIASLDRRRKREFEVRLRFKGITEVDCHDATTTMFLDIAKFQENGWNLLGAIEETASKLLGKQFAPSY
ncbi:MAG: hypothetical protein A3F24_02380 [Candidatus Colwellbacteria bacterium RIFCSPHIGHO2_12_FULL_44_17]|uniref:Uncharacterized protein n=2 Tax=Candidatus Colwelliibacteriota TaxID=1817904 RepID=A0A1G1Z6S7_9BACT|nr:MAG: hypothetical protein A3F24_02380 [Candidatus Colwellbacteria bacterium RIFCSPHIGHO2_12_FULL_44_17]OGY60332.1 MAG: hypothetical protein A3I31_02595 [Candidatus Colwellbacteria bacterium RIFCSPLOWO2_02_FULL_44_20b]